MSFGADELNEKGLEEPVVCDAPNEKLNAGVCFLSWATGVSGFLSFGVATGAPSPTSEEAGFTLVAAKESSGGSPPPPFVYLSCAGAGADADEGVEAPNEKELALNTLVLPSPRPNPLAVGAPEPFAGD